MAEPKTLAVIGAGAMGHGIAQLGGMAGYEVRLVDLSEKILEAAFKSIRESLDRLVADGQLDGADSDAAAKRITTTTRLERAVESADVVIEAVPELLELKKAVFTTIDKHAPEGALLASSTSRFSITELATATTRPEAVVGMHFFSPAVPRKLVEVVRGLETANSTVDRATAVATDLGKAPIVCRRDSPGFVTTRLIAALSAEAQRIVEEGLASAEEVDQACKLALGHPVGPFERADRTGLDEELRLRESLARAHGDRFRPTNLLRNLVAAGRLGRKTGRGFYDH